MPSRGLKQKSPLSIRFTWSRLSVPAGVGSAGSRSSMRMSGIALGLALTATFAQSQESFTLSQAVAAGEKNYPSVRVSTEQVAAAAAGIHLAGTSYLAPVGAPAQLNLAPR